LPCPASLALPRRENWIIGEPQGTHVFGKVGFTGFAQGKHSMDFQTGVTGWRLHDLRRSVATKMNDIGVMPHVVEAILNHHDSRSGVAGVYNRSPYERDIRNALVMWSDHVVALVDGRASKVVSMRGSRRR
jgi:hypothetical protein